MSDQSTQRKFTGLNRVAVMAVLAALIAAAAIYVIGGNKSNEQTVEQGTSAPSSTSQTGSGEMKNFVFATPRSAIANIEFAESSGAKRSLSDWKGKVVLLNLWATWCAPCRKEMPGLSRLQGELGGEEFEVVALSVDRKGLAASQKFLNSIDAEKLALYNDETTKTLQKLKIVGLPSTLLIDRDGKEVGRLTGPAEWDSADAKALVRSVLDEK
ncbi:MAG: TlpA family protein disulfide reductase [Hyphomicrobiales bacterium]